MGRQQDPGGFLLKTRQSGNQRGCRTTTDGRPISPNFYNPSAYKKNTERTDWEKAQLETTGAIAKSKG